MERNEWAVMKITQTKDIRTSNRWEIMKQVLCRYPISRADICRQTGLNKATVSTIVKEWIEKGLLAETELGKSEGGRKPILLQPLHQAGAVLALDIDIRQVQAILTDLSGETVLGREQFPTCGEGFPPVYQRLCQTVDKLLAGMPSSPYGLVGIGVAVHGVVDLSGMIRFIPRLGWRNIDLRSLLEERYRVPVSLDNDGNLAALAQQNLEQASQHPAEGEEEAAQESLAVVTVGDSISTGLITHGEVFRGYHGFANAIGHHTINLDEPVQCSCGKYGCWEQYCSDGAVIAYANSVLPQPISSLQGLIALIRHQDPLAKQVMDRFITYLAVGLTNLIFIFDCQSIAISSELLSALPYYLPEVMSKMVLPITHVEQVTLTQLGKQGAILGAARQAVFQFFRDTAHAMEPSP